MALPQYPGTSFLRMWTLIQNNYTTYFGRYKTDFPPELMLAIFWEESRFNNVRQDQGLQGQVGIGFGQVQEDTIKSVNKYWFDKKAAAAPMTFVPAEIVQDDQQSVQIAGLALAMIWERSLDAGNSHSKENVLTACRNYAGVRNHKIPGQRWDPCWTLLTALKITIPNIVAQDPKFISGVLIALNQALGLNPKDTAFVRRLFP
jgi:hypothetical protein